MWSRMNRKAIIKTKIKKLIPLFQTQINLYMQWYTTRLKITTLTFKTKKSVSPVMLWTVLLKAKMIKIHWTKSLKEIHWTKFARYVNAQKECTNFKGDMLLDIDLLDNALRVFEKCINLDEFMHQQKLESGKYNAQNRNNFEVFMDS